MGSLILVAALSGFGSAWATWRWQRAEQRRERHREAWIAWFVAIGSVAEALNIRLRFEGEEALKIATLRLLGAHGECRSANVRLELTGYDEKLRPMVKGVHGMIDQATKTVIRVNGTDDEFELEAAMEEILAIRDESTRMQQRVRDALNDRDAFDLAMAADTRNRPELYE